MILNWLSTIIGIAGKVVSFIEDTTPEGDKKENAIVKLVEMLGEEGLFEKLDSSIQNFIIESNVLVKKFDGVIHIDSDDQHSEKITITIPKKNINPTEEFYKKKRT